ncbi:hypothetical protein BGZ95_010996 [Linnemannia exigua]|uniref:Uncharacterized protein n=1 Tax=Linnemannia exigua TaxID=604196 RepID=A0AAD4DB26_9FUNG|nr:hypothetical protein BGZ95_010996 [Linnemannia exigua]
MDQITDINSFKDRLCDPVLRSSISTAGGIKGSDYNCPQLQYEGQESNPASVTTTNQSSKVPVQHIKPSKKRPFRRTVRLKQKQVVLVPVQEPFSTKLLLEGLRTTIKAKDDNGTIDISISRSKENASCEWSSAS